LTCACGGGGGGDPGNGNPPPSDFEAIAQKFVEDCGQEAADELIAFFALIEPLFNPNSTKPFPNYTVLDADPVGGSVLWNLELNGAPPHEVEGIFTFVDDMGEAVVPFDMTQLAGGLEPLPGLVASIEDGTVLETPLVGFEGSIIGQGLTVTFSGGTVEGMDVLLQFQLTECGLEAVATGVVLSDISADVPTLEVEVTLAGQGTIATGTITFDSTNTVTITLTPDGATQPYSYLVDLTTGAVTPAP
jgi:hypothetical protein